MSEMFFLAGRGRRGAALPGHPSYRGLGAHRADLRRLVERAAGKDEADPRLTAHRLPAVDDMRHTDREHPFAGPLGQPIRADEPAPVRRGGGLGRARRDGAFTSRRRRHAAIQ